MLTFNPPPTSKATGLNGIDNHEKSVNRGINEYERTSGLPLRVSGFVTLGPDGRGRAECHLVFQERPDMILLKRIFRKYGKVCVTGDYDEGEDWSSMALESKNHPPHAGCLHYTARHADYPEARVIENQIPRAAQSPCDASKVVVDQSAFDAGMRRYRADQRRRKARYVKRKAAESRTRRSTSVHRENPFRRKCAMQNND
jgi:hypothetical protein